MLNENVKEQIIDAFISVFNEYGHKVTLDKVAAFFAYK